MNAKQREAQHIVVLSVLGMGLCLLVVFISGECRVRGQEPIGRITKVGPQGLTRVVIYYKPGSQRSYVEFPAVGDFPPKRVWFKDKQAALQWARSTKSRLVWRVAPPRTGTP